MPVDLLAGPAPAPQPRDLLAGAAKAAPRDLLAGTTAPATAAPQAPGATSLAFQPAGMAPLWSQAAASEVAKTPGLDKGGQQAVYAKWQSRAFPVLPTPGPMPSAPVQTVNAFGKGFSIDTPAGVVGTVAPETALHTSQNADAIYPSDPSLLNTAARGLGGAAMNILPLALGGPAGAAVVGGVSGIGEGRIEAARRRERGEEVGPWQEAGLAAAHGAINAGAMAAGGKFAQGVLPQVVEKVGGSLLARGATAVAGDVAAQAALGAGSKIAQNAVTGPLVDENKPTLTEGAKEAAIGGAAGGLAFAPLTLQHAGAARPPAEPAPAPTEAPPPAEAPTPRQTPDAVAAVRESRLRDLLAERQQKTLQRRNPVAMAVEGALDAQDAAPPEAATTPPEPVTTPQRESRTLRDLLAEKSAVNPEDQQAMAEESALVDERQSRRRELSKLPAKELYNRVLSLGLKPKSKETNVETLLRGDQQDVQEPQAETGGDNAEGLQVGREVVEQPAQKVGPRVDAGLTNGGSPKQLPPPEAATPQAPPESVPPAPAPVKPKGPRPQRTPFSKASIERKLIDFHEQLGDNFNHDDDKALGEAGTGYGQFTFAHKLPGEIKHYIENNPAARRLFRVTGNPSNAGGEDAMTDLGDRYWQLVDKVAGNKVRLAKESVAKHGDPAMKFWNAVHDNLPPAKERPAQAAVDPQELNVGQEFELNGSKFQVVEDENGLRMLKDGDEYPEVPVDALEGQKIPVDTGTLKQGEEPELPEDPFGDLEPAASRATEPPGGSVRDSFWMMSDREKNQLISRGQATPDEKLIHSNRASLTPEQQARRDAIVSEHATAASPPPAESPRGIFGQETFDAATGNKTGTMFHEPVDVAAPQRAAEDQRFAGKFDESATPSMFQKPAESERTPQQPEAPAQPAQATPPTPPAKPKPTFDEFWKQNRERLTNESTAAEIVRLERTLAETRPLLEEAKVKGQTRNRVKYFQIVKRAERAVEQLRNGTAPTYESANLARERAKAEYERGDQPATKRIAPGDLSDVFGVDVEPETGQEPASESKQFAPASQSVENRGMSTELKEAPSPEGSVPPGVSIDDIPKQLAHTAYQWSSFDPEGRGERVRQEYVQHMKDVHARLDALAKTPEQKALLATEFERYRQGYIARKKAMLAADSRTASAMITGPSKFPTARNQKRLDTAHRRLTELLEFDKRAQAAIENKIAPVESKAIPSGAPDAVGRINDRVAELQREQDRMKAVNAAHAKFLKDPASLEASGLSERDKAMVRNYKPAYSWEPHPFPPYALQNNSANIRRLQGRSETVAAAKATPSSEQTFEGGRIVDNPETNRLQIVFDAKPSAEMRDRLKSHGFRWAPSEGAWQRFRGEGATRAAKDILGIKDEPPPEGPKPTDPRRRGFIDTAPLKAAADAAAVPAKMAKGVADFWSKPLVEDVESQAGERGKVLGKRMRASADEARTLLGRLHEPSQAYQDAVSGAPGKDFSARRAAIRELQDRVQPKGKDYAFSKLQLATEGKMPLDDLSPHAREIVRLRRELTAETGKLAVEAGVQVVDSKTGEVRPFVPAKDGMRYLRQPTPEFHSIAALPEGHPLKQAVAAAVADANGIDMPKAMEQVNQMAEGPLFRRNATETARLLEHMPAWVKNPETGRWVEILNTDPASSGQSMVNNAARRLSFIKTFGQDLPGQSVSSDLADQFAAAGGDRESVKRAIRALNGVPLDHFSLNAAPPGSTEHAFLKTLGSVYSVMKGSALTTAAVPNALESLTKTRAIAGTRLWAKAMGQLLRHPQLSQEAVESIGAATASRMHWMTRPGRTPEDVARAITDVLTYPMKWVNEKNETHAALTGVEVAKEIRAGKNPARAVNQLDMLGFNPEQSQRIADGRGTEAEYKAIATRFAERTQGSTAQPVERSRAGNSGPYKTLVPFDAYAQMTANRTARLHSMWLRAWRSGDRPRQAQATKMLAEWYVGHAAAGVGAAFIYSYLNGGREGVKEKAAEAEDAPLAFIRDGVMNAMVGGIAGRLLSGSTKSGPLKLGDVAMSMSYPATLLQEGFDAVGGTGKYKDMSPLERSAAFLKNRFAGNRPVATMMAVTGLAEDDHGLDVAERGYYRWRHDQKDLDQDAGSFKPREGRIEFRRHMRRAEDRMKVNDEAGAQREVRLGLGTNDKGGEGVASSIRGRKLIDDLNDEQRARLKNRIGPDSYRRLEAHDDLLESWAQAMKYESENNEGVHARHGEGLLEQAKTEKAVEKAYRPAKESLDAGDLGTAREIAQANRETLMQKPLSDAKSNRLAQIKQLMGRVEQNRALSSEQKRRLLQTLDDRIGQTTGQ